MTKPYQQWALDLAPPWLAGPIGELYVKALGLWNDTHVQSAVEANKSGMLTSDTFHESGLRYIGQERLMPRYFESDIGYRDRLLTAWEAWEEAGTPNGIQDQFAVLGVTASIYYEGQVGKWPDDPLLGGVWDWDDDTANWSRFWVVLTDHPWTDEGDWGDPGVYGDGGTWGTTASPEEVATVRGIAQHWKAAHVVVPHIIVVLDETAWDALGVPAVTTGDRYDIFENRSDAARYWNGYGKGSEL